MYDNVIVLSLSLYEKKERKVQKVAFAWLGKVRYLFASGLMAPEIRLDLDSIFEGKLKLPLYITYLYFIRKFFYHAKKEKNFLFLKPFDCAETQILI